MKVILSGSNGFVGSYISTFLLSHGAEIVEVGRTSQINWYNIAAHHLRAYYYIHTSAKTQDVKGTEALKEYLDTNLGLTQVLFNKFLEDDSAKAFIYFSSVKAAADNVVDVLLESDRLEVTGSYGLSKRAAEDWLMAQELSEYKRLYILRPAVIYGHNNKGNLRALEKMVDFDIPYPFGAYYNQRSFVNIDLIGDVIIQLINHGAPSGVYNIADDGYMGTVDWIRKFALAKNKKPRILYINQRLFRLIAKIGDWFHLPFNSFTLKKLTENYRVSNQKMRQLIFNNNSE